ncbi:hypothetical protein ACLB2K_031582 [Fragaria x ananassa]
MRMSVKLAYQLPNPIRQAYSPITYDFGTLRATANLTFRYERTFGFYKACGMLENGVRGCGGLLDMSEGTMGEPVQDEATHFYFFILGVLATDLIAHLNKFRAPLGGTSSVLVALVVPQVKGSNVSNLLPKINVEVVMHKARVKRIDGLENGVLLVSPSKKRKIGSPISSKNKQKLEDVRPWKLEVFSKGLKKAKRSFGIQRKLTLIEEKVSGMEPILEEVSGSVDGHK